MKTILARMLGAVALVLVAACSEPGEPAFEPPGVVDGSPAATGDFEALRDRGRLRLLLVAAPGRGGPLPAAGTPLYEQMRAASTFARSLDLESVVVPVDDHAELVPALLDGRGDLIVTNRALAELGGEVARTVAFARTRQMLVKRADDPLDERGELAGRTITVEPRSPYWESARRLQDARPALAVEPRSDLSVERKIELLAAGEIELTIFNRNRLQAALEHEDRIAGAFPVSEEFGIGFGLRPDMPRLKEELDRFIRQRALTEFEPDRRLGDLDTIQREGTLRLATRNDAAHYFVWRGRFMGFEYELAKRFADHLGVRLEVVIGTHDAALRDMVREGRADMAAAFLMRGSGDDRGLSYSRPYHHAVHQVVTDDADDELEELADLAGRTLHVRTGSDAWRIARGLRERAGLNFTIAELPAEQAVSSVLTGVAEGRYDVTIADDHIVRNAMVWNDQVRPGVDIGKRVANRWAFRAPSEQLREAADAFLDQAHRGEFYNVIYAKYFDDAEHIRRFRNERADMAQGAALTPYDDLFKQYAGEHGFDWRLIAAQAYQESSFNPRARSWAGAVGLLQLMPTSARQIGVDGDLEDPETNLRAGVRYLKWLRGRFEEDLSVRDRTWFMLAAYNAGAGHVRDARALAERLGLDPDRWFGNVEQAMLKLSNRQHFRDASFGYVRGQEPVDYVRDIRARYQAYQLWSQDCWPDCAPDSDAEGEPEQAASDEPSTVAVPD
ncbi:MAG: transporter substrate-binding domain-containing protein [Halofilum sp. (in: g-proteobacteria)]